MTAGPPPPALYLGRTVHTRYTPYERRFSYPIAFLLLDVDAVGETARGLGWLAHNRFGPFAFYDRDHGDRAGGDLRAWAEARFAEAGVALDGGALRLLTLPRVLGYVFNPISVWFGYGPDGALRGVIYEVNNTFGATHAYVAPATEAEAPARHAADKALHVSPFFAVEGGYAFALRAPRDQVRLVVENQVAGARTHVASILADRRPLTDRALAGLFFRAPLLTLQVIIGIHWQALWLWLRGARYHRNPGRPARPASVARPAARDA